MLNRNVNINLNGGYVRTVVDGEMITLSVNKCKCGKGDIHLFKNGLCGEKCRVKIQCTNCKANVEACSDKEAVDKWNG